MNKNLHKYYKTKTKGRKQKNIKKEAICVIYFAKYKIRITKFTKYTVFYLKHIPNIKLNYKIILQLTYSYRLEIRHDHEKSIFSELI